MSINHYVTATSGVHVFVSSGLIVAGLRDGAKDDGRESVWGDYFSRPIPITEYHLKVIANTSGHQCSGAGVRAWE